MQSAKYNTLILCADIYIYIYTHIFCRNLLSGFQLREVPPTAAEFISKHWVPATIEYPLEHRLRFIKDTIAQFEFLGVYRTEDNRYPVAWSAQKPGI